MRRWSWRRGAVLVAALATVSSGLVAPAEAFAATAPPTVAVSANELVDSAGHTITLHGVNRSGTEYACVQGWGFFDGPSDAASVRAMAQWNIDVVRLPLNEDCWLGTSNVSTQYGGAAYRTAIKNYVALLHRNGLAVILDLHLSDGAYTGPDSHCSDAAATCQKPALDLANGLPFWRSVATTFAGDHSALFDVFNEPYVDRAIGSGGGTDQAWKCWRNGGSACSPWIAYPVAGMQRVVDTIRATGATNPILLGGPGYSSDLSKWVRYAPDDPAHALVASWHSYNFAACADVTCWNATVASTARTVPVIAGEIGENDCADGYIDPLMSWLDRHGVSYLGWTWDTWDCASGPSLISDYSGTPTAFGVGFRNHLRRF